MYTNVYAIDSANSLPIKIHREDVEKILDIAEKVIAADPYENDAVWIAAKATSALWFFDQLQADQDVITDRSKLMQLESKADIVADAYINNFFQSRRRSRK